jgi:hypothetical protein
MPTKVSALAQAAIIAATDQLYAVVGGVSRRIPAAALSGRNRIINGQGRINQRGYVSGTATIAANQYTLDRWRVVVSGQSLTFTGTDAGRTMTAPAGGCEQVIEGANIEGGTYIINWTGTATCQVDGIARAKGATFTLTANTNATVRFIGGTFSDVQVELGSTATPFERLPISCELARCQRYYCTSRFNALFIASGAAQNGEGYIYWPVTMRISPLTTLDTTGIVNATATVAAPSTIGARASIVSVAAGLSNLLNAPVTANAEL